MGDSFLSNDKLSQIWESIWTAAKELGRETTKIALELFYVMKSPDTGMLDKVLIGCALGYQFLGEDLLDRDEHPWLGFLDNGITLLFAYSRVQANVTPEIRMHVEALLDEWFGPTADDSYDDDDDNGGGDGNWYRPADSHYGKPVEVIDNYPKKPTISSNTNQPPKMDWSDDDIIVD